MMHGQQNVKFDEKLTFIRQGLETNSTEKSPCWEAISFSDIQEILRMLWDPEGLLAPSQDSAAYPVLS
jgi:hypothetical protein